MISSTQISAGNAVRKISGQLKDAGFENPRLDARLLAASVMGIDVARLFSHPEMLLTEAQSKVLEALTQRRLSHEPVSRILGFREFWSLEFQIDESTLDPRPDSETLIEAVLERIPDHAAPLSILDMGTGSGCLVLALLSELTAATGVGIDISAQALEMAAHNAKNLGLDKRVQFAKSNWFKEKPFDHAKRFDVIISNPPYISDDDILKLEPDVRSFDPIEALSGGQDGLRAYRELLADMARYRSSSGIIALEIGWKQAAAVEQIGASCGLKTKAIVKDIADRDRVLILE